jgi:hypothetical protein
VRRAFSWSGILLALGGLLPGQIPDPGPDSASLLSALASKDALAREMARRRLAVASEIPVAEITALLRSSDAKVVVAAAALLRDRQLVTAKLHGLIEHPDAGVRREVLPVVTKSSLLHVLAQDPDHELRIRALFELEDQGLLTDALLVQALLSEQADLRSAACRLIVYERSPFPVRVANQVLKAPVARRALLDWLADRPRAHAGPWLHHVLDTSGLSQLERLLAIHALPPDWINAKMAAEVLAAAVAESAVLNNRAASSAARFTPEIADGLVPAVLAMVEQGSSLEALIPVLSGVTQKGERLVFEAAKQAGAPALRTLAHWLSSRRSSLLVDYVVQSLDAEAGFAPELVSLTSPALRVAGVEKPQRIDKVVAILQAGGTPAVAAYVALLDADVFRAPMLEFAEAEAGIDQGRRIFRLFNLPPASLPLSLFRKVLAGNKVQALTTAVHALSRTVLDPSLEPLLLEFALHSKFPVLRSAATRTLVLRGSADAGRKVFRTRQADTPVIEWLMDRPRPWSRELLSAEFQKAGATPNSHDARDHQVLVALANLGDEDARQALVAELPHLRSGELQSAQKIMGRYCSVADLERIANQYLMPKPLGPDQELEIDGGPATQRREELLSWFVGRTDIGIEPLLANLWETDRNYQIRLVALRGLLARDSMVLHGKLQSLIARPYGEAQEDLAFEVVGSMSHPLSEKAIHLLARILLLAPLSDPKREVRFAIEQTYDGVRGAYPLNTPASVLLRRDEFVRPGRAFAGVAADIGKLAYAVNRQRIGLFMASLCLRPDLQSDLGPVLAKLIVDAPDRSQDFLGPAQWVLADQALRDGDLAIAADLYQAAARAFCRGIVPFHIQRSFCGDVDPANGRHPYAALAAEAVICRARLLLQKGQPRAAHKELARARDLAEGDAKMIERIQALRRVK